MTKSHIHYIIFTEKAILTEKKFTLKRLVEKNHIPGDIESIVGVNSHIEVFSQVHRELRHEDHVPRIIHIETVDLFGLITRMPIGTFPKHQIFRNSYNEGYIILEPKVVVEKEKSPSGILGFLASLVK